DERPLTEEAWVDERNGGKRSGRRLDQELRVWRRDREVLRAPQAEKRDVAEVVAMGHALGLQAVPNRWIERCGGDAVVVQPVGLGGVHVEAVRVGLGQDRAEVAVATGVVERQVA